MIRANEDLLFADLNAVAGSGSGRVAYTELFPSTDVVPLAPRFMFGDVSSATLSLIFTPGRTSNLGYFTTRDVHVTAESIVIQDGTVLTNDSVNLPDYYARAIVGRSTLDLTRASRAVRGQVVAFAGPGWSTWGHWIVDFLPRLYLFWQLGHDINQLRWLIPGDPPRFIWQLLELVGLHPSSIITFDSASEVVGIEELLVPQNMTARIVMHPAFRDALTWLCSRVFARMDRPGRQIGRKVFITRRGTPAYRTLINRDEVEEIVLRWGYEIVDPTRLSVLEQIDMARGATHIAGEYGSGLHTSVFAPPGCIVTCLRGNGAAAGFLQNGLAKVANHQIGYAIGATAPEDLEAKFTVAGEHVDAAFDFARMLSA